MGLIVDIRMYRVNELGDCFLLKFKDGDDESAVLIDCGSFRNGEKSINRMNAIAKNIAAGQNGSPLNVVVGTHQHNDHMSGFNHAKEIFIKLGAEEGWLSWLDDPTDEAAQRISDSEKKFTNTIEKIQKALEETNNNAFAGSNAPKRLSDMLGFYTGLAAHGNPPAVPAHGLQVIREMSKEINYLKPGDAFDLPGLAAGKVKVYVLGPPRNSDLLFDIHAGKNESYDPKLKVVNETASSYLKALSNFSKTETFDPDEQYFPFDKSYQVPIDDPVFIKSNYFTESKIWQKIDSDWLEQAERLALYLDSYTNNTSLVLAFELLESEKVLLFVGDAQTGSWLSWKKIDWKGEPAKFNVDDLLKKTVLYKVGHHCSHNATLVEGLEKMTHEELVAMIPVDKNDPLIQKEKGWRMPAQNLYLRLKEKTKHRVLRMDDIYDEDCDPEIHPHIKEAWDTLDGVVNTQDDLFISYTVHG